MNAYIIRIWVIEPSSLPSYESAQYLVNRFAHGGEHDDVPVFPLGRDAIPQGVHGLQAPPLHECPTPPSIIPPTS